MQSVADYGVENLHLSADSFDTLKDEEKIFFCQTTINKNVILQKENYGYQYDTSDTSVNPDDIHIIICKVHFSVTESVRKYPVVSCPVARRKGWNKFTKDERYILPIKFNTPKSEEYVFVFAKDKTRGGAHVRLHSISKLTSTKYLSFNEDEQMYYWSEVQVRSLISKCNISKNTKSRKSQKFG